MMFDAKEIGGRIKAARLREGYSSQEALAEKLRDLLHRRKERNSLTRQTVQGWEAGNVIPPWSMVAVLSEVLGDGEDELLFGKRRGQQLGQERQFLIHLNEEEAKLVTAFRKANAEGQRAIMTNAVGISRDFASPAADVVPLTHRSTN